MIDGEKTTRLLWGTQADRSPFSETADPTQPVGDWKYLCPNCGPYALLENEHNWIENYCSPDQRLMLFEYLRDNPAEEGKYNVLTMEEIKKILQESPPGEL